MSFDGALGNVQIASNLGVVTSLQQEIYNLLLPGGHLVDDLIHDLHLAEAAPDAGSGGCWSGRNWKLRVLLP